MKDITRRKEDTNFMCGWQEHKIRLNTKNNKWNNNIIMVMISTVDHFRIRKTVNPTDHSLCDQLPVGLLAQLVKQCTGIAQVMGSNSVKVWFFWGHIFTTAQEDCFHIYVFICSSHILFSYIYSHFLSFVRVLGWLISTILVLKGNLFTGLIDISDQQNDIICFQYWKYYLILTILTTFPRLGVNWQCVITVCYAKSCNLHPVRSKGT